jgi:DNA polymerase III subunit delta
VTAVAAKDVDAFVARPDPRRPIVLVYGPDQGLVRERVAALLQAAGGDTPDPFSTVAIEGDVLAGDPGRLADEARAIGLFGGKRLVHIRAGSRNFADALSSLLADPPQDALIVIEAGDLKKTAPLRKLTEASKAAAALPCYQDDERSVARLIDSSVKDAGMTIDGDARESLIGLLGADRMASRSELEKLILFVGDRKRVEFADVLAAIADSSALGTRRCRRCSSSGRRGRGHGFIRQDARGRHSAECRDRRRHPSYRRFASPELAGRQWRAAVARRRRAAAADFFPPSAFLRARA